MELDLGAPLRMLLVMSFLTDDRDGDFDTAWEGMMVLNDNLISCF